MRGMHRGIETTGAAASARARSGDPLRLADGSRVAVIGGGPAGSFFAYFLLELARRAEIRLRVDLYEPRDFSVRGPAGCNMCGGIVSESLVQALAAEGIRLPPMVVERGINAYVLHAGQGTVRIATPLEEKRIAAVHRGGGPRGDQEFRWSSFDRFLLDLAQEKGTQVVRQRVEAICRSDRGIEVQPSAAPPESYELVAAAVGVKTGSLDLFDGLGIGYRQPRTCRAFNCELYLGEELVQRHLGQAMHIFLPRAPGMKFGALIPKGAHVTICLLGDNIDRRLAQSFVDSPEVRRCLPSGLDLMQFACQCGPKLNVGAADPLFADRLVFIGDCGVTRLYKDGIGAAYRTAKAAAVTAVFEGISAQSFQRRYLPTCRAIERDNALGRAIFTLSDWFQTRPAVQRGILRTVECEQRLPETRRRMSTVLWDLFTGSAPYSEIVLRALHPGLWGRFLIEWIAATVGAGDRRSISARAERADDARDEGLGRVYAHGECIVHQGERGSCMYLVEAGQVEVAAAREGGEVRLAMLGPGEIFGEMSLCDDEVRSATVRAVGSARVLTVDRSTFLRRLHEDPSVAMRVIERLSRRVRALDEAMLLQSHRQDR